MSDRNVELWTGVVPKSLVSYLMGAMQNNFSTLKNHFETNFKVTNSEQLLEELFRYLYIFCDCAITDEIEVYPSRLIGKALCCLLWDVQLHYQICDQLLKLREIHSTVLSPILPHNSPRKEGRFTFEQIISSKFSLTLSKYLKYYGKSAPEPIWSPPIKLTFQVFAKCSSTTKYYVSSDDTVESLRLQIHAKTGNFVKYLRYQGQNLSNTSKLRDYNVNDGATLWY